MQAQATERPRFRQDLVAELIDESGQRFIDLIDPETGNTVRFYDVEYSIACAMDGERDIAGLVRWAQEELGVTPSATEVRSVVAALGELGYLAGGDVEVPAHERAAPAPPETPTEPVYVPTPAASPQGPAVAKLALKRTPVRGVTAPPAPPPSDDELAPGVIVAPPERAAPTGVEFELGASGGYVEQLSRDLPPAADLELGASGGAAAADLGPTEVIDIPLGIAGPGAHQPTTHAQATAQGPTPHASEDMSLDLADHMAIRRDDVKEAVRASRVMSAVEVPPELAEAIGEAPAPAPAAPSTPAQQPVAAAAAEIAQKAADIAQKAAEIAKAPEVAKPQKAAETAKPAAAAAKPAAAAAAAKPAAKPAVESPRGQDTVKPTAPQSSNMRRMLLLFLLLVVIAGAYFAYREGYIFGGGKAKEPTSTSAPPPAQPPAPPPPEVVKLAPQAQPVVEIKAGMIGQLDMVAANGSTTSRGALLATIAGHERLDSAIADEEKSITTITADVANFQKDSSPAGQKKLADAQSRLATHQATLTTKKSELEKFQVRATVAGSVETAAQKGARVTTADVIAKITPAPLLVAKFHVPAGMTITEGLAALDTMDHKSLICPVTIDSGIATVTCASTAAAAGDSLTLKGQAPAGATASGADDGSVGSDAGSAGSAGNTGSATGSAAGSASGSGSAAAGSAAAGAETMMTPPPPAKPAPVKPVAPKPHPTGAQAGSAQAGSAAATGDSSAPPPPAPAPTPAPDNSAPTP